MAIVVLDINNTSVFFATYLADCQLFVAMSCFSIVTKQESQLASLKLKIRDYYCILITFNYHYITTLSKRLKNIFQNLLKLLYFTAPLNGYAFYLEDEIRFSDLKPLMSEIS